MPMKPRTFRRVVLLGSLGAIILMLAFGYFVVRPWQNQRQLEAMRTDGLAAYNAGNMLEAEKLLGRYKNNAENPDAEVFLRHAQAREVCEVPDYGHIAVAIDSYREYLRRVPDDIEVKMDLLPLMNNWGMYVEAEALAGELIEKHGIDTIEVTEELNYALSRQEAPPEKREPVLLALFEHPDRDFDQMSQYLGFLASQGRQDESDQVLDAMLQANPDGINERILGFQRSAILDDLDDQTVLDELSAIIGLDSESNEWHQDAPSLSAGAARHLARIYNAISRPDLSTTVQARVAQESGDRYLTIWSARRLYWSDRDEELNALEIETDNGEPDPDVLGYQYLSAVRANNTERATQLEQQLRDIQYDRRAPAWIALIDGEAASEESRFIDARLSFQNAIDWYPNEPTIRLRVGQQHLNEGRFQDAIEQWRYSSEFANGRVGADSRLDVNGWSDPMIRIVSAYSGQDRLLEALDYIIELERIAPKDQRTIAIVLETKTELARRGELPYSMGARFLEVWETVSEDLDPRNRAAFAPNAAIIFAAMNKKDMAREEVRRALEIAGDDGQLVAELLEVDDLYQLGAAASVGFDSSSATRSSPLAAMRAAISAYQSSGDFEAGVRVIQEGLDLASESDKEAWERVLISFVDEYDPVRAVPLWTEMLESHPDDLEVLYFAIESNAIGSDLNQVDALIQRVTQLTESEGKVPPARLRLARANAMVAQPDSRNRTNRAQALEIVRAVVAAEPLHTKARNMLGRLLALPPSPGLDAEERYTPDYEGAIEQYRTLARQLSGRAAQNYMLECVDLAYRRLGDARLAGSLLDEYSAMFGDEVVALSPAATRYENIGQDDKAASIYERLIEQQNSPGAMLSLAELRLKQKMHGAAKALLAQASGLDELNARDLLNLAGLYVRAGNLPEGELIASSGERYGLEPVESLLTEAKFAELYLTPEEELRVLEQAVAAHKNSLPVWKQIIRRTLEYGDVEKSQSLYAQSRTLVKEDAELARLGVLTRGAPQTAMEMLELPGMQNSPILRQALERVEAYSTLPENTDPQVLLGHLRLLVDDFPQIEAVQVYAVEQLARLQISANVIAEISEQALRNVPSNTSIMGIAGESHLRANNPDAAIRVIDLWRTNSLETTIIANAIRARALIQKNDLEGAEQELEPFIDLAYQTPSDPVSREMLDAYSFVRLSLGEDPSLTAQRLQPLLATNDEIRTRVWLNLASNAIKNPDVGADWIRIAADYSKEEDSIYLANAWTTLAFTHAKWDSAYALESLALVEPMIEQTEDVIPHIYTVAARAHLILARDSEDPTEASHQYEQVVDLMLEAAQADPTNLMPKLDAARYAREGRFFDRTISIYEQLLGMEIPNDGLNAMISNNLAMTMIRAGIQVGQRSRVQQLVQNATEMQSQVPSYWGTRGWVELELGELRDAYNSFKTSIRLNAVNPEGWVGLTIVTRALGDEFADESEDALQRVRGYAESSQLDDELIDLLRTHQVPMQIDSVAP